MKKRMISLILAMVMCFALGITSFAIEPPTLHQTMMELSPGYDPLAWSNWIGPYVAEITVHDLIEDVADVTSALTYAYSQAAAKFGGLVGSVVVNKFENFAKSLWVQAPKRLLLVSSTNLYFEVTHKWRYNEATLQIQHDYAIEIYADADYTKFIGSYSDTETYYQNLNKSI